MAFVKVTEAVVEEVIAGLHTAMLREIRALETKDIKTSKAGNHKGDLVMAIKAPEMAEFVERCLWREHYHLRNQMPQRWMVSLHRCSLHINKLRVDWEGTQIFGPPNSSSFPDVHLTPEVIALLPEPWQQKVEELLEQVVMVNKIHEKYRVLKAQVKSYLESRKSLNEAVKLYPDLKIFLSDEIKAKLDKKYNRNTSEVQQEAESAVAALDLGALTAAAVANALDTPQGS